MSIYKQLQALPLEKQIELLTKHLVSFNSINGTNGKVSIIDELYSILKSTLNTYGFNMYLMIQ